MTDQAQAEKLGSRLTEIVDRLERLEEERKQIAESIRDVLLEARLAGLNPAVLRELLRLRRVDTDTRLTNERDMETYKKLLGM